MSNLEMQVEALKRCVDPAVFARAMAEVTTGEEGRCAFAPPQLPGASFHIGKEIRGFLAELGMPPHIKGHRCAATAIRVLLDDPKAADSVTKELYPLVAESCETTPSRVERAIRHGVECVWDRGDLSTLHKYFGNTVSRYKGKPTNSEFLMTCAIIIRERLEEQNVQ